MYECNAAFNDKYSYICIVSSHWITNLKTECKVNSMYFIFYNILSKKLEDYSIRKIKFYYECLNLRSIKIFINNLKNNKEIMPIYIYIGENIMLCLKSDGFKIRRFPIQNETECG